MMTAPALRFLADESCDFAIVRALRAEGYDVLAVSEVMQRSDDSELINQAYREGRILLTEDKDSGWLVYVSHADSSGVILIRYPGNARRTMIQTTRKVIKEQGEHLLKAFVVGSPATFASDKDPEWPTGKISDSSQASQDRR
jgi:predicted nuclease of predicted toxin-antitoxin system